MATNYYPTERAQVSYATGLNFFVGVWLLISGYATDTRNPMVANNLLVGLAVSTLALIRAGGPFNMTWLSWANAILGAWAILSPWVVLGVGPNGASQAIIVSNCVAGAAIVALGSWSALRTRHEASEREAYPDASRPSFGS